LKLEWDLSMDELEYGLVTDVLKRCSVSSSSMPVNVVERLFVASDTTVVVAADTDAGVSTGSDSSSSAYYQNCSAARAAGAAPILFGEPGYRPALDRDGDGVACE